MDKTKQNIIAVSAIVIALSVIVFGTLVVQKLERTVQVAERTEAKLDYILKSAAPVGKAAVDKGTEILKNVDEEELARSAEEGIKEVGAVTKSKLIDWIATQKVSETNKNVGNLDIRVRPEQQP